MVEVFSACTNTQVTLGPALTALWSKAPPLICTLSLTSAWVRIPVWACGKVASDLGSGGVFFTGYSGFLHYLQLVSHELAIIGINVTKNKIPNPQVTFISFIMCLNYF